VRRVQQGADGGAGRTRGDEHPLDGLVAALIATVKLLPWRTVATRGIAVLLAVLGIALAFAPEDVPGLTVPDPSGAAPAWAGVGSNHRPTDYESPERSRLLAAGGAFPL